MRELGGCLTDGTAGKTAGDTSREFDLQFYGGENEAGAEARARGNAEKFLNSLYESRKTFWFARFG